MTFAKTAYLFDTKRIMYLLPHFCLHYCLIQNHNILNPNSGIGIKSNCRNGTEREREMHLDANKPKHPATGWCPCPMYAAVHNAAALHSLLVCTQPLPFMTLPATPAVYQRFNTLRDFALAITNNRLRSKQKLIPFNICKLRGTCPTVFC